MTTKNIIKQVIIVLLSCVVIALVLGLVFYKYMPSNTMVPAKVEAYTTPENIASEIEEESEEQKYETTNTLLEVTDSDLNKYKSSGSYNPGKSNPFSEDTSDIGNSESTDATQTDSSSSTTDSGKSKDNENSSTDNYYQNAGISKGTK